MLLHQDNLTHKSGKKISQQFIDNFDLDIQFLENFAKGLPDANVGDAFTELRQVGMSFIYCRGDSYSNPRV
jgi:hypothetical protein